MKPYWTLFTTAWDSNLIYRTNIVLWRLRNLLNTLFAFTLWSSIFAVNTTAVGYTPEQMYTYIFLSAIMGNTIMSTALHSLPGTVYNGDLSYWLLRPLGLFRGYFVFDFADKLLNIMFVVLETAVLIWIFHPPIALAATPFIMIGFIWVILGILIHFFIEMLFGAIGFVSPDVWGPKFLFFMFVEFSSGRLFPLDILPKPLQVLAYLTPFPYFGFAQTQVVIGRYSIDQIALNSAAMIFWCIGFWWLSRHVWKKGTANYAAHGR